LTASVRSFLALGSNLGDRLANLQRATDLLGAAPGIRVRGSSRVWETDPVGGPDQPDYLNAVVELDTDLSPHELLSAAAGVEHALGRVRDVRWGPRTIDVDILLMGALAVDDDNLVVPHPRMTERSFVILPLLELEPDPVLPDGRHIVDIPLGPDAAGGARPFAPPLSIGPGY
jgi:2-amino-4-hydroxy-6-hydroxymethyldihydropteridine diphosphokinase